MARGCIRLLPWMHAPAALNACAACLRCSADARHSAGEAPRCVANHHQPLLSCLFAFAQRRTRRRTRHGEEGGRRRPHTGCSSWRCACVVLPGAVLRCRLHLRCVPRSAICSPLAVTCPCSLLVSCPSWAATCPLIHHSFCFCLLVVRCLSARSRSRCERVSVFSLSACQRVSVRVGM